MPKIEVVETLLLLDIVVGINVGRGNRDTGRRVGSGVNGDLVGVVEVDTMTGDAVCSNGRYRSSDWSSGRR